MAEKTPQPKQDVATEEQVRHIPLYRVLLHNDDVNSMGYVVAVLQQVFHFDQHQAEVVMLEAHQTGVALCVIESLEQAEFHAEQLTSARLTATTEPEG
jgi:ATP-dependent Clp protease adaptor protein ClpS